MGKLRILTRTKEFQGKIFIIMHFCVYRTVTVLCIIFQSLWLGLSKQARINKLWKSWSPDMSSDMKGKVAAILPVALCNHPQAGPGGYFLGNKKWLMGEWSKIGGTENVDISREKQAIFTSETYVRGTIQKIALKSTDTGRFLHF